MYDKITEIVGHGAIDEVNNLKKALSELKATFDTIGKETKKIELDISAGASLKELMAILEKVRVINGKVGESVSDYNDTLLQNITLQQKAAQEAEKSGKDAVKTEKEKQKEKEKTSKTGKDALKEILAEQEAENKSAASFNASEKEKQDEIDKTAEAHKRAEEAARQRAETEQRLKEMGDFQQAPSGEVLTGEAKALWDEVKARQDNANAMRLEAQEKAKLAAATTDSTQRQKLETEARELVKRAIEEERTIKETLHYVDRELSDTIKKLLADYREYTKAVQELQNIEKREAQSLATGGFTDNAVFQEEVQILWEIIKARQENVNSLKAEAEEKARLAGQATDDVERQRLEAEASNLNKQAIQEQRNIKKDLAESNKEVSASVKTLLEDYNKETVAREKLLEIQRKEVEGLSKAGFKDKAEFEAEAQALWDIVKARQENINALRQEAEEYTKLAAESSIIGDYEMQVIQETQAREKLKEAIELEKKTKEDLRKANTAVSKTVRDNLMASNLYERQTERLEKKQEQEVKTLERKSNAYLQLRDEYDKLAMAAKNYGAAMEADIKAGTLSTQEIETRRKAYAAMVEEVKEIGKTLAELENDVGDSRRAQSQYNAMLVETNQILRELPNFAISARTGILSLSNNLPMFADAWQRAAAEIDNATGRALGWRNAMKSVTRAIFSWQTLLIVGITLLIQYNKQFTDWIMGVSAGEKVLRDYEEALKETIKQQSKEIAQLHITKLALEDENITREQRNKIINDTKQMFPGYFDSLNEETKLNESINDTIERQIQLRIDNARQAAAYKSLEEAVNKVTEAERNLGKEVTFWQKLLWTGNVRGLSAEEMVHQRRIKKLDEYKDAAETAYRLTLGMSEEQIMKNEEEIEANQKLINEKQEYLALMNGDLMRKYRRAYEKEIKDAEHFVTVQEAQNQKLRDNIKLLRDKQQESQKQLILEKQIFTATDLEILRTETQAARLIKDTKERIALEERLIDLRADRTIEQFIRSDEDLKGLDAEAILGMSNDEIKAINEDLFDYIDNVRALAEEQKRSLISTRGGVQKQEEDDTRKLLSVRDRYRQAVMDMNRGMLEDEVNKNTSVMDNEEHTLSTRLAALEDYTVARERINELENQTRIDNLNAQMDKIREIERKAGVEITEDAQLESIKRLNNITKQEKDILREKLAVQKEIEAAEYEHQAELSKIALDEEKRRKRIIENDTRNRIAALNLEFNALREVANKETAMRLAELEKQRADGTVQERHFWRERRSIFATESQLLFELQMKQIREQKEQILSQLNSTEIPEEERETLKALLKEIERFYGDLERARPEPKQSRKMSWAEVFGFEAGEIEENYKSVTDAFNKAQSEYELAVIQSQNRLYLAKQQAAKMYGEGTEEYNKAVMDATNAEADTLLRSSVILESARRAKANADIDAANRMKMEIKKRVADLLQTMRQLFDELNNAYFQRRIDQLDREKQKINEVAEADKRRVQSLIMGEKERAEELAKIDAQRMASEKNIEQQQKALERERATRAKTMAIFQATIEGYLSATLAIRNSLAAGGNVASAIVAAALVMTKTLANLAMIQAQSIPAYAKGTPKGGHKGGLAIVGEEGTELVRTPKGKQFLTPPETTLMDLPKGTEVIPHHELAKEAHKRAIIQLTATNKEFNEIDYNDAFSVNFERLLHEHGNKITKAITNKKELDFHWDNGELRKSIRKGGARIKYVGKF